VRPTFELIAGLADVGNFDHTAVADAKAIPHRELLQIKPASREVFAKVAVAGAYALGPHLGIQLFAVDAHRAIAAAVELAVLLPVAAKPSFVTIPNSTGSFGMPPFETFT
jgi:hypothetical protein